MTPNQYTFRYRVRNWSDYNRALILKSVFHLSLRSTQGFVSSLLELLRLDLPVPDYSTLSRRQSSLATFLTVSPSSRPRHVVVDATGLRVYGSGEWHVRKHRHGRRRAWRKLHLGVDERTKEIVAVEVTPSRVHDCRLLPVLLDQIPGRIVQVSGDGAYDTRACYQSILEREAVATIPPRRSARLSESVDPPDWRAMRDTHLREIRRLGRYEWRISSGCTGKALQRMRCRGSRRCLGLSCRPDDSTINESRRHWCMNRCCLVR